MQQKIVGVRDSASAQRAVVGDSESERLLFSSQPFFCSFTLHFTIFHHSVILCCADCIQSSRSGHPVHRFQEKETSQCCEVNTVIISYRSLVIHHHTCPILHWFSSHHNSISLLWPLFHLILVCSWSLGHLAGS